MKVPLKQRETSAGAAALAALEHLVVLLPASRRHTVAPTTAERGAVKLGGGRGRAGTRPCRVWLR